MTKKINKIHGKIYTPKETVCQILDLALYASNNPNILKSHVMDNSCGDGAFLKEILLRYVSVFVGNVDTKVSEWQAELLKKNLETYIHGIEKDPEACEKCRENLDNALSLMGIDIHPQWDIKCENALKNHDYDGKMDFVVGNPPYVRIHNLKNDEETLEALKEYKFCNIGSTDLYMAFYELGLRMLSPKGCLCYISPSGWLKGPAGREMRNYVQETGSLYAVIDNGHKQMFDGVTAYTALFKFYKKGKDNRLYYACEEDNVSVLLNYNDIFKKDEIWLGDSKGLKLLNDVENNAIKTVRVKNGIATLLDGVFIYPEPKFAYPEIPILKASTGEMKHCLFPHSVDGTVLSSEELTKNGGAAWKYLLEHFDELSKRDYDGMWYSIGRKQGLSDISKRKIAVNNIIRTHNDLKIKLVDAGTAVYSGYYILFSEEGEPDTVWVKRYLAILDAMNSEDFDTYVKALKKYKSGGYYTFTAKHLEKFLNWKLNKQ